MQWNTELVAFEQKPDHVAATIRQPDGSVRTVTAAWVAGCDGSRSAVRELSGIGFPGAPYEHMFFVADTEATGAMRPGELNVYLWRDGFHLFFPMRGKDRWRVIGILPEALRARDDLTFDEVVPSIAREAGADLAFRQCDWFSTYRIHHRAAERFRDRRCFLLGDAAHIHSPAGAQGMNTGLQDAYNLAWKLALVVQGRAGRGAARQLRAGAHPGRAAPARHHRSRVPGGRLGRLAAAADAHDGDRARRRDRDDDRAGPALRVPHHLADRHQLSGRARCRRRCPACRRARRARASAFPGCGSAAAGRSGRGPLRALDDTRFNLLVFGDAPAEDFGDMVRTHVIARSPENDRELARANISRPSFYLLRPDGHVGLAGPGFDAAAIRRWLAERALEPPAIVNARDNAHVLAYPGGAMNHQARHTLYVAVPTPGM